MRIYDLAFTDGKSCRYIVPEPQETEAEELRIAHSIFCGRLASMNRIIAPPPDKLPWRRQTDGSWRLGLFVLTRAEDGNFHCAWPGGEVTGGKDEISATVRRHWESGSLT